MDFHILHGHRYSCDIDLTGFETWASDEMIADRFRGYGFVDVEVTGSGSIRQGIGTWNGPDTDGEVDPHLANISEAFPEPNFGP